MKLLDKGNLCIAGNTEGQNPIESVSITGIQTVLPTPMKHMLCEAKTNLKEIKLSSKHCVLVSTMCV